MGVLGHTAGVSTVQVLPPWHTMIVVHYRHSQCNAPIMTCHNGSNWAVPLPPVCSNKSVQHCYYTLQEHQKLMTEIRYITMQLLPFNMGVYGELVFIEFCLYVFTHPSNLYIKKIAIMMRAVTTWRFFLGCTGMTETQTDFIKDFIWACGALLNIHLYLCHPCASKENLHVVRLWSLMQIFLYINCLDIWRHKDRILWKLIPHRPPC